MVDPREQLMRELRKQVRRHPTLHRASKELLVGYKLLRLRQQRRGEPQSEGWRREPLRFDSPCRARTHEQLRAQLIEAGVELREGRHTIYLSPEQARAATGLLPEKLLNSFPRDAGFKILKRFAPPQHAHYLLEEDVAGERDILGDIYTQCYAAAALYALELGPRLYDIVHLSAYHVDLTVLVSRHVEGVAPDRAQYDDFMSRIRAAESAGLFELPNPSGYDCGDWAPSDCNANLISTPEGPRYVDSQMLLFDRDATLDAIIEQHKDVLHFGDVQKVVAAGQKFLYQDVPGYTGPARRDTQRRWTAISAMLESHGAAWQGRPMFDVCCNSGMMMHRALSSGASWAYGWDLPKVAEAADRLLCLAGSGRSTLMGCSIDDETNFTAAFEARPPTRAGICMFLAAWHHVSFPQHVGDLDWQWLVYEGKENEDDASTQQNIETMQTRWNCKLVELRSIRDGLSQARPLALLARV